MRNRLSIRAVLALAVLTLPALALPASLLAQFQPPTQEELKMTSDPKAPGADAIYLYREETVDDNLHYHSFYERVKILTEKAKDLANVGVPYPKGKFTVDSIQARTIHSDGTVIPLDVKPTDLVEHKGTGFQINKMVFTLPSVEVGSILEYRWQIRYDEELLSSPDWDVQQRYYVRKAHYSFIPYKDMYLGVTNDRGDEATHLLYSYNLPTSTKVVADASGRYTLDVTDIPPIPKEEYMPPLASLLQHVEFYYSPYNGKDEYWKHEGDRWSKEMDHFAERTGKIKEAAASLVAPTDSEDVKAHKIYDAVMALDNTDYTRTKSTAELKQLHLKRAKDAEGVWTQKAGTSDEIALLYLALARAAGLKAYATTVCNRDRRVFNPFYMWIGQFDDVLVLVNINGKEIPLDPGKKFAPFGELDWRHALVSSLRQDDKGTELSSTPGIPYKDATTLRVADLTIDRDGAVKGIARISMSGPAALRWRELAIENDEDEIKKQFNEQMRGMIPEGVNAEFDHFLGLEDYHLMLMGIVKISGNLANGTGKRLFLPGLFFEARAEHPFVAVEYRQTAVDMGYADTVEDEVTYHLPDGFKVESAPADTSIPWTGHAAFILKSVAANNDVTVGRTFVRAFALLAPKEYPALRDFYQKVATADQQQLVLTSTPAAKAASE